MRSEDLEFRLQDLLEDLREANSLTPELRFLHTLLWDSTQESGRVEVIGAAIEDARAAVKQLSRSNADVDGAGVEDIVWLRKVSEHLALLIRFSEGERVADYWLWIALHMHVRGLRLLRSLQATLTAPSPRELRWAIDRYRTPQEIALQIAERYPPGERAPWFVSEDAWHCMLGGDVHAIRSWHPPSWRRVIGAAMRTAHPGELTVLGHYELTYSVYSFRIHASAPGDDPSEMIDVGLLALTIALLAHRIAAIVDQHVGLSQRVAAAYGAALQDRIRLGPPPAPGDRVAFDPRDDYTMIVVEVSSDGLVARVRDPDGSTMIRPCMELLDVAAD